MKTLAKLNFRGGFGEGSGTRKGKCPEGGEITPSMTLEFISMGMLVLALIILIRQDNELKGSHFDSATYCLGAQTQSRSHQRRKSRRGNKYFL